MRERGEEVGGGEEEVEEGDWGGQGGGGEEEKIVASLTGIRRSGETRGASVCLSFSNLAHSQHINENYG